MVKSTPFLHSSSPITPLTVSAPSLSLSPITLLKPINATHMSVVVGPTSGKPTNYHILKQKPIMGYMLLNKG